MIEDPPEKTTLRSAADLVAAGLARKDREADLARVGTHYAIAISPAMASLIEPGEAADPIARQFVPDIRELDIRPEETADPIGDHLKSPLPGLVHRYSDRVLLKLTGICPVYCRFCFRREMVGPDKAESPSGEQLAAAYAYIRERPAIWEVILTGGDPLIMSPRRVAEVTSELAAIPHVKVLRWHTRVPVVAPERITQELVSALVASRASVVVGVHANHPRELTAEARAALHEMARAGIVLVSQSVLLAGVNDDPETLEALMRGFVEAGVKPYYLHHPDRARGTAHFRVGIARGRELMAELRRRLSGLALPTYVLDVPGASGKVPLEAGYAQFDAMSGAWLIIDRAGGQHVYTETM